jgi:small subunit ribosomal protein S17
MSKKQLNGVVVKKYGKTITVSTESLVRHKKYSKLLRRKAKFLAHDESESAQVGDEVRIVETKPISKLKTWELIIKK